MHKKLQDTQVNIDKIKELYNSGTSVAKIAQMFNVGQTSMFRFFAKHNIDTRNPKAAYALKHLSKTQEKLVWKLYYSGLNREEIAKRTGFSHYSIRQVMDHKCLPLGEKHAQHRENKTISLTYDQKQLILGSLLGDACLSYRIRKDVCKRVQLELSIPHCVQQLGYLEYAARILDANISKTIQSGKSKSKQDAFIHRLSFSNKYELIKIHNICFIDGRKSITPEWMQEIDAAAIAYWFMDDGSSTRHPLHKNTITVKFATQSFDRAEHKLLQQKLLDFGIETTLHKANGGTEINVYVRQKSINKLMDLIEPIVSKIPCMLYKIKRKI